MLGFQDERNRRNPSKAKKATHEQPPPLILFHLATKQKRIARSPEGPETRTAQLRGQMQAEFAALPWPIPWLSPAHAAASSPSPPTRRRLFSAAATATATQSPSRAAIKAAIIKSPADELN